MKYKLCISRCKVKLTKEEQRRFDKIAEENTRNLYKLLGKKFENT